MEMLSSLGADFTVHESYLHTPEFYELIAELPEPKLALDAVGGSVAADMARCLGSSGTLVRYGCLSGAAPKLPQSVLKSKSIAVKEFSLAQWSQDSSVSVCVAFGAAATTASSATAATAARCAATLSIV
jgi:mitochondrial enoyl-[acyl-carrier protein] reductase / trans-2-enoyl-CoA reductase